MTEPDQAAATLATAGELFARRYARPDEGAWSAPGRVNLIGEHTDYNGGRALPIALAQSATVVAARRSDDLLRVVSAQEGDAEVSMAEVGRGAPPGWLAYLAGPVWSLARRGGAVGGLDVALASDVPEGAGLSSSAAVACATLLAARDLWGGPEDRTELAVLAQQGENTVVGVPTGLLDQLASLLGVPDHALLVDFRRLQVTPVPLGLGSAGLALVVIDTRQRRALADGEYAARRRSCEEAAAVLGRPLLCDATLPELEAARPRLSPTAYRRARHVLTEDARVTEAVDRLRAGAPRELGPLLVASHRSLQDDFAVSTPALDLAVDSALDAGAYGARMTGGGFGGCALALVDASGARGLGEAVTAAFAAHHLPPPDVFPVRSGAGARRLR